MYISVTQRAGTSNANAPNNNDDEINFRRVAEIFCDFFDGDGVEPLPETGNGKFCSAFSSCPSSFTFVEGDAQRGLALDEAALLVTGIRPVCDTLGAEANLVVDNIAVQSNGIAFLKTEKAM
jgi:hypothetical protein